MRSYHRILWAIVFFTTINSLVQYTVLLGDSLQTLRYPNSSIRSSNCDSTLTASSSSSVSVKSKNGFMVIDCFPYNGEDIVAARLAILNPYVDLFFISEYSFTFSGTRKELLFKDINADVFKPYKDKIIWIGTEESDENIENITYIDDAWLREEIQRNAPIAFFQKAIDEGRLTEPFVVINTDADEIPNPSIIQNIMPGQSLHNKSLEQPIFLKMKNFYYNFNWLKGHWGKASLVHSKLLFERELSPTLSGFALELHEVRKTQDFFKFLVDDGGWHCSFCLSVDDIINKLSSFSHHDEYNKEPYTSRVHIQDCILNGKDIFNRTQKIFTPYHNSTQHLPKELQCFNKALVLNQNN